jgi:hypothetical protein
MIALQFFESPATPPYSVRLLPYLQRRYTTISHLPIGTGLPSAHYHDSVLMHGSRSMPGATHELGQKGTHAWRQDCPTLLCERAYNESEKGDNHGSHPPRAQPAPTARRHLAHRHAAPAHLGQGERRKASAPVLDPDCQQRLTFIRTGATGLKPESIAFKLHPRMAPLIIKNAQIQLPCLAILYLVHTTWQRQLSASPARKSQEYQQKARIYRRAGPSSLGQTLVARPFIEIHCGGVLDSAICLIGQSQIDLAC